MIWLHAELQSNNQFFQENLNRRKELSARLVKENKLWSEESEELLRKQDESIEEMTVAKTKAVEVKITKVNYYMFEFFKVKKFSNTYVHKPSF